jgi:hypothetical protein
MNKTILFLLFYCSFHSSFTQPSLRAFINPTGTYILKGEKNKGEIVGNFAEIRFKLISDSLLAFTMYCNKGYPEYTSGSITDTIAYTDNTATVYVKSEPSCQIHFSFVTEGVTIKQLYSDPASTCGFGKGVIPLGFIEKHSSETPIIQSLARPR